MKPAESALPFVSVIIPTFNDADCLGKCLLSLREQTYPADLFEIIVVDNGSDESPATTVAMFDRAILLTELTPGSYAARNAGIRKAKGGVFAFLDADCIADSHWLETGIVELQTRRCDLLGGDVRFFFKEREKPSAVELFDSLTSLKQEAYVNHQNFAATANLIAYKGVFAKVGEFAAHLKSGGDCEWCNRAVRAGYKIAFSREAFVWHPARVSFPELLKKHDRIGGGLGQRYKEAGYGIASIAMKSALSNSMYFTSLIRSSFSSKNPGKSKIVALAALATQICWARFSSTIRVAMGAAPNR